MSQADYNSCVFGTKGGCLKTDEQLRNDLRRYRQELAATQESIRTAMETAKTLKALLRETEQLLRKDPSKSC
jgi:hypothetical protein